MLIVDSEKCIGCGTCVLVCPTDAIKLRDIARHIQPRQEAAEYIRLRAYLGGDGKDLVNKALRTRLKRSMGSDDGRAGSVN